MVLLPVAVGIALVSLLVILRRERYARVSGRAAPRPAFVNLTLAAFAVLALLYIGVYVVGVFTANQSEIAN